MNDLRYAYTRPKFPSNDSRRALGHSPRNVSMVGGKQVETPVKCAYVEKTNAPRRCIKTEDGEHDHIRCEVNDTTGRCRVVQSKAQAKPPVASFVDSVDAVPESSSSPLSDSIAFQNAFDELAEHHIKTYRGRWLQERMWEKLGHFEYNPNYVSRYSGLSIRNPFAQASDIVNGYFNRNEPSSDDVFKQVAPSEGVLKPAQSPVGEKTQSGCVQQTRAKYTSPTRKSPPYPANQCHGKVMVGNDGNTYQSVPNAKNIYTWKKLHTN